MENFFLLRVHVVKAGGHRPLSGTAVHAKKEAFRRMQRMVTDSLMAGYRNISKATSISQQSFLHETRQTCRRKTTPCSTPSKAGKGLRDRDAFLLHAGVWQCACAQRPVERIFLIRQAQAFFGFTRRNQRTMRIQCGAEWLIGVVGLTVHAQTCACHAGRTQPGENLQPIGVHISPIHHAHVGASTAML